MKKVFVIGFLLIFNLCVVYAKIKDQKLDKVDIKLKDNELAIITINLDKSNSLLLKYQDKNILYLINYLDKKNIDNNIKVFTNKLDYIYMTNNYNYQSDDNKIINKKVIDDLTLTNNRIFYNDYNICINQSTDCDLTFIYQNDILINSDVEALFYFKDLDSKYIDYLNTFWNDKYRLSKDSYTIITLGNGYEVNNLVK